MNNPSPLVPQGSLPQPSRGKSTVRIAIFTIVAIHAVFFAGLLMQGCKRDDANKPSSNNKVSDLGSSPELAKLDTNYYQDLRETSVATIPAATAPTNTGIGYQAMTSPLTPAVTQPPATEPPVSA